MEDNPRVAAIVPTLNRADRLERALDSVVNQTYDPIEIVVVDGGSTDRTPEVVAEYEASANGKSVTYINNDEPHGLPAARNQGANETDAGYLAFLDDDDRWHPEKIERQIARLQADGDEAMCYTGLESRTPDGDHVHTKRPTIEGDVYEDILVRNDIGTPSTVLVTREAFESVDGFDEELRHQEDWDFYIRLAREYEVACIPDPLVTRLYHADAMSRDVETQTEYREQIMSRYADQLRSHGVEATARAVHHRDAGVMHCLNGDVRAGNREFRRALSYETDTRTLLLYVASKTSLGFRTAVRTKRLVNRTVGALS
jgi:glycosyltransferase involved in cell wall biosynthesis